jgi:hypothetical protein
VPSARKRWKYELLNRASTGTLGLVHGLGWMAGEIFVKWMQHFKEYANPSEDKKVLLIME